VHRRRITHSLIRLVRDYLQSCSKLCHFRDSSRFSRQLRSIPARLPADVRSRLSILKTTPAEPTRTDPRTSRTRLFPNSPPACCFPGKSLTFPPPLPRATHSPAIGSVRNLMLAPHRAPAFLSFNSPPAVPHAPAIKVPRTRHKSPKWQSPIPRQTLVPRRHPIPKRPIRVVPRQIRPTRIRHLGQFTRPASRGRWKTAPFTPRRASPPPIPLAVQHHFC
jgi:hypothetical protein